MFGITNTLPNHLEYTKNEWTNSEYYKRVVEILSTNKIKSFIDIGSCSGGLFDILSNKISTIEKGVLVEANPTNFDYIKNRLSSFENIVTINYALFYGVENLDLGFVNNNVGGWSYQSNSNKFQIKTITLENIISNYFQNSLPDFVKIDIEGAEFNFLENSTILKDIPFIEIEFHPNVEYGLKSENGVFWNEFWRPFISKHLPNHDLIFGGEKNFYDGSGFLKHKNY